MKKIHLIAGARPNFMKIAPLYHALKKDGSCTPVFVHTGQHYDPLLSSRFLEDLMLPAPDFNLEVGSGSHAEQTAKIMLAYEKLCLEAKPDLVVVVGDVNSTLAACLVAKKLSYPVAHLEAGLRSFDRSMPEEINRVLVDSVSDYLWTPSPDADQNLKNEGVASSKIRFVGNIMIDSYLLLEEKIKQQDSPKKLGLESNGYGVLTLHRPANVDSPKVLSEILAEVSKVAEKFPILFPIHPRTKKQLSEMGLLESLSRQAKNFKLVDPLGYVEFMSLVREAKFVLTDSGGVQEETTFLKIPCLTLRENTERPITITQGTNRLLKPKEIYASIQKILDSKAPETKIPEYWDGKTAARIVELIKAL